MQGAALMAGDVECVSSSACPALVARSETVRWWQGQRRGFNREARQQRCRARSSAPALGQRRAGAQQRLFVIASLSFSCSAWLPGVRQQAASQQRCRAMVPEEETEEGERRKKERERRENREATGL